MDAHTRWISSNARDEAYWHLGIGRPKPEPSSGHYYVTACRKRSIGGSYGYTVIDYEPRGTMVKCPACARIEESVNRIVGA